MADLLPNSKWNTSQGLSQWLRVCSVINKLHKVSLTPFIFIQAEDIMVLGQQAALLAPLIWWQVG